MVGQIFLWLRGYGHTPQALLSDFDKQTRMSVLPILGTGLLTCHCGSAEGETPRNDRLSIISVHPGFPQPGSIVPS